MEDAYLDDGYQDVYYDEPEPKKKMSGWLIALIIILVLICICCICVAAALLILSPAVSETFSVIEEMMTLTPMP